MSLVVPTPEHSVLVHSWPHDSVSQLHANTVTGNMISPLLKQKPLIFAGLNVWIIVEKGDIG